MTPAALFAVLFNTFCSDYMLLEKVAMFLEVLVSVWTKVRRVQATRGRWKTESGDCAPLLLLLKAPGWSLCRTHGPASGETETFG